MVRFRFHRGNLDNSLKTTIQINNKEELLDILNNDLKDYGIKINLKELKITYYGYDFRCNWDTWLVSCRNNEYRCVVGMTDGEL